MWIAVQSYDAGPEIGPESHDLPGARVSPPVNAPGYCTVGNDSNINRFLDSTIGSPVRFEIVRDVGEIPPTILLLMNMMAASVKTRYDIAKFCEAVAK